MSAVRPCASCGASEFSRSRRRSFEFVLSWLGLYPYRCTQCDARFYRFGEGRPSLPPKVLKSPMTQSKDSESAPS